MVEFSPFWTWPLTLLLTLCHHSSKEGSSNWGESTSKPSPSRISNQVWRAKTQDSNKWFIVSSSWSHRGHFSRCAKPFLASRSAVQHLLWATNHIKNLHLPGAQLFQILSQGWNWMAPMNIASYADFAEYCPDTENFQMWESSTSGCNTLTASKSSTSALSVLMMIMMLWQDIQWAWSLGITFLDGRFLYNSCT